MEKKLYLVRIRDLKSSRFKRIISVYRALPWSLRESRELDDVLVVRSPSSVQLRLDNKQVKALREFYICTPVKD